MLRFKYPWFLMIMIALAAKKRLRNLGNPALDPQFLCPRGAMYFHAMKNWGGVWPRGRCAKSLVSITVRKVIWRKLKSTKPGTTCCYAAILFVDRKRCTTFCLCELKLAKENEVILCCVLWVVGCDHQCRIAAFLDAVCWYQVVYHHLMCCVLISGDFFWWPQKVYHLLLVPASWQKKIK